MSYEKNIIKQCFLHKDIFLECFDSIQDDSAFSEEYCQLFWKVFTAIYKEAHNLSYSAVNDVLKFTDNANLMDEFRKTVEATYVDESEWKYHLFSLIEAYRKNVLLGISVNINNTITDKSAEELTDEINQELVKINVAGVKAIGFKKALHDTVQSIQDINDGKSKAFLATGHAEFDNKIGLSKKQYILIAANLKIGKTRLTVDLMDRIINLHNDVAIQWYSFEMNNTELLQLFIGRKLKMTDAYLTGKRGKIKSTDMEKINTALQYFDKYPIEFIDEQCGIYNIAAKFEKFCKSNPTKHCFCIIDNIGLITPTSDNENSAEGDIARVIKATRDKTNGTIIALHHLTKEADSKWNKDAGYEPKLTHIRGNKRLIDFANQVILLHRPDAYPDLVEMAEGSGQLSDIEGLFVMIVAANRNGDTGQILFKHDLKHSTFTEQ